MTRQPEMFRAVKGHGVQNPVHLHQRCSTCCAGTAARACTPSSAVRNRAARALLIAERSKSCGARLGPVFEESHSDRREILKGRTRTSDSCSMATIAAWRRVLGAGFDELNLWELAGRDITIHSGGISVSADLPRADVREALTEALRTGLLQLYDMDDPTYPVFSLEEALVLAADDGEWDPATALQRPGLTITPAGERALHGIDERYRRASPFLALGIADPRVIPTETPS